MRIFRFIVTWAFSTNEKVKNCLIPRGRFQVEEDELPSVRFLRNRSKTSASFSSGAPNTEKQIKARRRRRSAFIVSRCLEPLMKNEARVFELASQTSMRIFFEE